MSASSLFIELIGQVLYGHEVSSKMRCYIVLLYWEFSDETPLKDKNTD